jgi:hypothetical protein
MDPNGTGLLVLGLLCLSGIAAAQDSPLDNTTGLAPADEIQPYDGPIGAGSPLYGLKLAMENIDESFTPNQSERVDKQVGHSRLRIAEVRRALELNQSDSAQQALDQYWQKMNLTLATLALIRSNATGLLHAQEQIEKHQLVLEQLLLSHPNNMGLQRAYNNSIRLEEKLSEKTAVKFDRIAERNNRTILRAIGLEQREMERSGRLNATIPLNETHTLVPGTGPQAQQDEQEKNLHKNTVSGTPSPVITQPTPAVTGNQQQGQQNSGRQNGNNGSSDSKGKGNFPNK